MRVRPIRLRAVRSSLSLSLQFEGDRDTKRPCDFNARSLQDHEEDEDEDEDNPPARTSKKRTESGSMKPTPTPQTRPQPASVSPPPHKRARLDSIEIPSDATPAATSNSTPAPPLPPSLLHPSLQPLLAQSIQSHLPSQTPHYSLAHLYNMVQQHSLPSDSHAALINLLRSGALQSGRFNSQQPNQNPGHPDGFLASLAELASTNPGTNDGIGGYGLGPGGSAFDWPTGLGSSSNAQEPQPSTSPYLLFHILRPTHEFIN